MTGDAGKETAGSLDKAGEKYEIVVKNAPQPEKALRWVGSLITGVVSQGAWGAIPGGQRISVKERTTGETVETFKQGFGNDHDVAGNLMGELTKLSVAEFEDKWVKKS